MGIVHRPATAYGQELRKWEQHHTQYAIDDQGESRPGNPYRFRQYPRMLYRAAEWKNGQMVIGAPLPSRFDSVDDIRYGLAIEEAEAFTRGCQRIVNDESEERIAKGQGWALTPAEALELAKKEAWELAQQASNAAWHAERMSEKAHAEFEAAQDAAGVKHDPDPAPPKKRMGRPKKLTPLNTPAGVTLE